MPAHHVGIVGVGAIGLASAAALMDRGHAVTLWAPRGPAPHPLLSAPLTAQGAVSGEFRPAVAADPAALCAAADTLLVAVPANGHRTVMDAILPHLRPGQVVIVSSMASLSALYLYEAAQARGVAVTVAAFGTTVLTARRTDPCAVRVMTRRAALGVSALPAPRADEMVALCTRLFGDGFSAQANVLETALTNINPEAHGPLAVFNWTRIERAEHWPQYHYMTPRVAAVIERLEAERQALAAAFGVQVRSIERHFAQSFGTRSERLADIAAELHAARGGPPGPTDTGTRFLAEDMPFGLVFCDELGRIAGVPTPATRTMADVASLIAGRDFAADNDLLLPLGLAGETIESLVARVSGGAD